MVREPRDPREGARDERDPRQLGDTRDQRVVHLDPRDARLPGDARDERTILDIPGTAAIRKAPATIIVGAYSLLGFDLWAQPARWSNTPAYGVLLDILPQWIWGSILLVVAGLLGIATWLTEQRIISIIAHFVAIAFTAGWLIAFIARRVTDDGTTAMNPVTWAVLLAILIYSMRTAEAYRETLASRDPSR